MLLRVYLSSVSVRPSTDTRFHALAAANNAAVNTEVQMSVPGTDFNPFCAHPEVGSPGLTRIHSPSNSSRHTY